MFSRVEILASIFVVIIYEDSRDVVSCPAIANAKRVEHILNPLIHRTQGCFTLNASLYTSGGATSLQSEWVLHPCTSQRVLRSCTSSLAAPETRDAEMRHGKRCVALTASHTARDASRLSTRQQALRHRLRHSARTHAQKRH